MVRKSDGAIHIQSLSHGIEVNNSTTLPYMCLATIFYIVHHISLLNHYLPHPQFTGNQIQ